MRLVVSREVARRFRDQHGVISHAQLHALGVSRAALRTLLTAGQWEPLGPRAVRLAGSNPTPEQHLLGLCLRAGPAAIASNLSAAWVWKLTEVPARHEVTVPRTFSARTFGGWTGLWRASW